MRGLIRFTAISAVLLITLSVAMAKPLPADDHASLVVVFNDGHRRTFSMNEIARIDLKTPSTIVFKNGRQEKVSEIARIEFDPSEAGASLPGRAHFIGKWEVGDGGGHNFFITLDEDGDARKTLGSPHGTWSLVDGEARITWDDGWHDAIRKVGSRHEKRGYEPGKSFDDQPTNVANARNTQAKPI